MVLLYWAAIGTLAGAVAHLILRSRGEQGYNLVGEIMLGNVGALVLAMTTGIILGSRHVDLVSGVVATIGAIAVLSPVVWLTLRTSPARPG